MAVRGPILWAIETKTSLSFEVVAQARRWRHYAHLASVCVPATRRNSRDLGREFALRVCEAEGVGVLTFDPQRGESERIRVDVGPRPVRRPLTERLRAALHQEQKTAAPAGSNRGGYWTPWQRTCREIVARVKGQPGITIAALLEGLEHHYASHASARGSILKWAEGGRIKGVRVSRADGKPRFFPDEK